MLFIVLSLSLIIFSISIFQINLGTVLEVQSDAAERWQVSFQDPATPIMEGIEHFHNDLMFFYYNYSSICDLSIISGNYFISKR